MKLGERLRPDRILVWILFATVQCFGGQASLAVLVNVKPEARMDVRTEGNGIILMTLAVRLHPGTTVDVLLEMDTTETVPDPPESAEPVFRTSQSGLYSVPIRNPKGIRSSGATRLKLRSSDHSIDSIVTVTTGN
jgi:hypothetical protein